MHRHRTALTRLWRPGGLDAVRAQRDDAGGDRGARRVVAGSARMQTANPRRSDRDRSGRRPGRAAGARFCNVPFGLGAGRGGDARLPKRWARRSRPRSRALGAQVDFAPVLDLLLEPASTVIGTRALGDDPARVAPLGAALVRGLQAAESLRWSSIFPGTARRPVDSHLALPHIEAGAATLRARELVPFAAAIAAGALGVMAGHLFVPALDGERPARSRGASCIACCARNSASRACASPIVC
jgi:beta-glucosidase-like glycosyl hydrolase